MYLGNSFDLWSCDLDPMTLILKPDLDISNIICTSKIKFVGQGFQKL